tara:strand:+ start:321 stop:731 length:411 start_codon:yes stop_codon:yes gene_type:complete
MKNTFQDKLHSYAYGDCHILALALFKKLGLKLMQIRGVDSGMAIHYFNLINDKYGIDGNGVQPISEIVDNYKGLTFDVSEMDEDVEVADFSEKYDFIPPYDKDDLEVAFDEFQSAAKLDNLAKRLLNSLNYMHTKG